MFGCDKWEVMVIAINSGGWASNVGDDRYVLIKV